MTGTDIEGRLALLEARLSHLDDRRALSDVYRRYMRGFDRNDVELLRSAFWPDAQINYREQVNTVDEFITRHLDNHVRGFAAWGHLLTNENFEIDGDTAHCETYVTALFVPKSSDDGPMDSSAEPFVVAGRYVDRVDRRGSEWRIAVREFVSHFHSRQEAVHALLDNRHRAHALDREDVSYRRPLLRRPA